VTTVVNRIGLLVLVAALAVLASFAQNGKPSPSPQAAKEIHRWLDIDTLSIATRYRFINARNGATLSNQQQFQFIARGRFKFDRKGKYSVYAGLATGNNITSGWNNTGLGTGDPVTNIFPKLLYLDAKPVKPIEIQFGGLGINGGENTEITAYDNDTYLTGERIVFRAPKKIYFDEVSLSNGYFGDITHPSVFRRFKHLNKSNYHQFLVRKQVTKRIGFSADYTFEAGIDTLRQAVKVKVPELRFTDTLLFENYQRLDPNPGYGFGITGEKKINSKLSLTGGFAKISHVMFNSDRFPRGERLYLAAFYKPIPEFTIAPVIIQSVGPLATSVTPRTRFEVIMSYNILEAFHRFKIY
jgi:hypothetical protein